MITGSNIQDIKFFLAKRFLQVVKLGRPFLKKTKHEELIVYDFLKWCCLSYDI
jgi:hypothetical protein